MLRVGTRRGAARSRGGPIGAGATAALGVAAALLGGALIEIGGLLGLGPGPVIRDVAASYELPVLVGAGTALGVTVMVVCGALAAFTARLVTGRRTLPVAVALLSLAIGIDDQFMLHERVVPEASSVPEEALMAVYAAGGILVAVLALRELGWRGTAGLWPALVLLCLSVVADLQVLAEFSYVTDDLLKLAGLTAWTAFWWSYCGARLRQERRVPPRA